MAKALVMEISSGAAESILLGSRRPLGPVLHLVQPSSSGDVTALQGRFEILSLTAPPGSTGLTIYFAGRTIAGSLFVGGQITPGSSWFVRILGSGGSFHFSPATRLHEEILDVGPMRTIASTHWRAHKRAGLDSLCEVARGNSFNDASVEPTCLAPKLKEVKPGANYERDTTDKFVGEEEIEPPNSNGGRVTAPHGDADVAERRPDEEALKKPGAPYFPCGVGGPMRASTHLISSEPIVAAPKPRRRVATAAAAKTRMSMSKLILTVSFLVLSISAAFTSSTDASACKRMSYPSAQMPQVVLVHGFTGGAWSWYKVSHLLKMSGYNVTKINLMASGTDLQHISEVETFDDYNSPLDEFMSSLPRHERVVVVGHSAGGVSVTKTLIDHTDKVLAAVYIAATMLRGGYESCQDLQIGVPGFDNNPCSKSCPELPKASCFRKSGVSGDIPLPYRTEDAELRMILGRPGPFRAIVTTKFSEAVKKNPRVDTVPRVYLHTLYDTVLTPHQQDAMIRLWRPCEVVRFYDDHFILASNPQVVAAVIANATLYV